ncbi:hypothetical protein EGW08_006967 [Elysia chlorotica]|uniref:Cell death regulator Aven n=1 Tax=Elysia chlorotica TaxID=188477 RepID=A0A3S1HSI7_ELYCH|nr:hypothetical protein EGW08_006967 [Elysia chlorotica]
MRPDEHKKKKNAAYKKKHGIGQTKAGQSEDKSKSKSKPNDKNKDNSQAHKAGFAKDARENKGATSLKQEKEDLTSSSDSEETETRQPRKHFQRRQIVSNWQKYELQPDDEEQLQTRGESFEALLSKSGDAVAHFRFKDEQEWDAVGALGDSKTNDDHYAQYLNLDTQQIGQAMNCLPLYKVLGLSPELFPNDEVEVMEKKAAEKRQTYAPVDSTPLAPALFSSKCSITCADQKHLAKDTDHTDLGSSTQQNSQKPALPNHSGSSLSKNSNHKTVSSVNINSTSSLDAQPHTNQKLVLQDEDLDSLLDQDSEALKVTTNTSDAKLIPLSKQSQLSDLSKTSTTSDSFTARQEVPASTNKQENTEVAQPKKDGVDLEDWLDSILDD